MTETVGPITSAALAVASFPPFVPFVAFALAAASVVASAPAVASVLPFAAAERAFVLTAASAAAVFAVFLAVASPLYLSVAAFAFPAGSAFRFAAAPDPVSAVASEGLAGASYPPVDFRFAWDFQSATKAAVGWMGPDLTLPVDWPADSVFQAERNS